MADEIKLRVSLLGDAAVGKTSLIERFAHGKFRFDTNTTICDLTVVRVQVEGDIIRLNISDNAGVECYSQMARSFNRHVDCLILVYDVNNKHSFDHLPKWFEEIKENCEENTPLIVVGNKVDYHYYDREVSNEDIVNYARGKEAIFMETSAKDGFNVDEIFFRAVKMILKSQGMLLPGTETDLFIRHVNRDSTPVPKRELKKVVVAPTKQKNLVVPTNTSQPKPKRGCC